MVLSFSRVYASVATVTRFRVLEALLGIVKEIVGKIVRFLDGSDNRAHNLLNCTDDWKLVFLSTDTVVILHIRYSEYVLYACVCTQVASPAESGIFS